MPGKSESISADADCAVLPVNDPPGTIVEPVRLELVLYSNSTVVFELFGLTVAFRVAVVPEFTPVAADVVAVGELASLAEST